MLGSSLQDACDPRRDQGAPRALHAQEEQRQHASLPPWPLLAACGSAGLPAALLGCFAAEGDNAGERGASLRQPTLASSGHALWLHPCEPILQHLVPSSLVLYTAHAMGTGLCSAGEGLALAGAALRLLAALPGHGGPGGSAAAQLTGASEGAGPGAAAQGGLLQGVWQPGAALRRPGSWAGLYGRPYPVEIF